MAPDITAEELDKEVLEELRSLPGDLADLVGRHLVAAERALEDDDPEQAHEHTKVARRFAARIGVVREAAGIVAYRAGHYSEALSDLRAARRMTGSDSYLPVMADCERGLGRPERAIDLVRSPEAERLDRDGRIEMTIVESGARRDLGQFDAAVITLQRLPELRDPQPKPWSARLAFAYADALADAGHQEAAADWFERAMTFDEDGETDAAERYAELTGSVIEDIEEDLDDEDESVGVAESGEVAEADEELLDEAGELLDEDSADDVDEEPVATGEPSSETGSADVLEDESEEDLSEEDLSDDDSDQDLSDDDSDDDSDEDGFDEDDSDQDLSDEDDSEVAEDTVGGAEDAGKPAEQAGTPGITPAFIEPNFGDVLDVPDETAQKRPKSED
ncbi:tetratricopeptide repeat protein [Nonomuraea terrae]|uniref:tetratricopeptide repeat protein n=1 Tax=Nonomuraea terrae TaxID=2530383 RepID=UPI0037A477A1